MKSRAVATWNGGLAGGSGVATSPGRLIAAAHAACYRMALSNELGEAGVPPEHLEDGCPVSKALAGNVVISVDAALA